MIKSIIVYFVLWLVIRVSGRRTLGQLTVFDFILFLIIGGAAQRTLMAQDYSLTHAFLVIATFVLIDIAVSLIERRVPGIGKILKGVPTIVVENGRVLSGRLRRARLKEDGVWSYSTSPVCQCNRVGERRRPTRPMGLGRPLLNLAQYLGPF